MTSNTMHNFPNFVFFRRLTSSRGILIFTYMIFFLLLVTFSRIINTSSLQQSDGHGILKIVSALKLSASFPGANGSSDEMLKERLIASEQASQIIKDMYLESNGNNSTQKKRNPLDDRLVAAHAILGGVKSRKVLDKDEIKGGEENRITSQSRQKDTSANKPASMSKIEGSNNRGDRLASLSQDKSSESQERPSLESLVSVDFNNSPSKGPIPIPQKGSNQSQTNARHQGSRSNQFSQNASRRNTNPRDPTTDIINTNIDAQRHRSISISSSDASTANNSILTPTACPGFVESGSVTQSMFTLFSTAVGGGMLVLPFCMHLSGGIVGIIGIILGGVASNLSIKILMHRTIELKSQLENQNVMGDLEDQGSGNYVMGNNRLGENSVLRRRRNSTVLRHSEQDSNLNLDYGNLVGKLLGPRIGIIFDSIITFVTLGVVIAFFDFFSEFIADLGFLIDDKTSNMFLFTQNRVLTIFTSFLVILPLAYPTKLSKLKYGSVFATFAMLFTFGVVVGRSIEIISDKLDAYHHRNLINNTIVPSDPLNNIIQDVINASSTSTSSSQKILSRVLLEETTGKGLIKTDNSANISYPDFLKLFKIRLCYFSSDLFKALANFLFVFNQQIQVPIVANELKVQTVETADRVANISVILQVVFYIIIASLGYLSFGEDAQQNILTNYPLDDGLANVAKGMVSFVLLFGIAINVNPALKSLLRVVERLWKNCGNIVNKGTNTSSELLHNNPTTAELSMPVEPDYLNQSMLVSSSNDIITKNDSIDNSTGNSITKTDLYNNNISRVVFAILFITTAGGVAVAVPQPAEVIGLTSSFFGTCLMILLPACLSFYHHGKKWDASTGYLVFYSVLMFIGGIIEVLKVGGAVN